MYQRVITGTYPARMEARKANGRYVVTDQGRQIAALDTSVWRGGSTVELAGRRFSIRANAWCTAFTMADEAGAVVASADRVGHKRWTVTAAGRTYHFRRRSWIGEEELVFGDARVGSIRKPSFWRGDVVIELPGLPAWVQFFILGVAISSWNMRTISST